MYRFSIIANNATVIAERKVNFDEVHDITSSEDYSPFIFRNNKRNKDNSTPKNLICFDIDDGMSLQDSLSICTHFKSLIVTTRHHKVEKKGIIADRYRIIIPIDKDIPKDEYKDFYISLSQYLGLNETIDKSCNDLARYFYHNPKQEVYYSPSQTIIKYDDVFKIKKQDTQNLPVQKQFQKQYSNNSPLLSNELEDTFIFKDGSMFRDYEYLTSPNTVPIRCFNHHHEDKHPSAFISRHHEGKLMAICTKCQETKFIKYINDEVKNQQYMQEEQKALNEMLKFSSPNIKNDEENEGVNDIISKNCSKITKDMLPIQISNWINDVCERIESPFEIGVVNALSLIGNLIGNRVAIKPKKNDYNYLVYPNLWGMVIGSPSIKKTPVFNEISKSISRVQLEINKKYENDYKLFIEDMNLYSMKKKEFEKKAKKNEGKTDKFDIEKPSKPKRTLHYTQDATIEAIAQIIDENPKGLLILRDELSGFLKNLDAVNKEEYRSFYLEGWSSGQKSIERKGSPSLFIPKLTLGVLGNIQPSIVKNYVYEAVKGHKADGLLQRFQLLVFAEPVEIKAVDRTPNTTARKSFDDVIEYIINTEEFEGVERDNYNKEVYYSYSNEAQEEFLKWYINNSKEAKESNNEALESHLGKYDKLINSLALIFHICELSEKYERDNFDISLENFQRALKLTDVFKEHAKMLYSTFEIEEKKKDELYQKIENKIKELSLMGLLPLTFGEISQKVAKASAKDIEIVARDIAIVNNRKVLKLKTQ